MLEVFTFEQGTPEWHECRRGIPTASEFKSVLAKGEGKTRRAYMMRLIGERMTGECAESYTNAHMERGKEMEAEARNAYSFMKDAEPELVGFLRDGDKGASPDSLVDTNGLLEVKTKLPHLQVEVLLGDRLPPEHVAQVQGALWVSGREWLDFVSYWPKMPLFIKRVHRDEAYIAKLATEVAAFNEEMLGLLAKLQPTKAAA